MTGAQKKKIRRIMIAAPKSGSGKTTITCGLLQIFKEDGEDISSCKCGPDYIDPMFHRQVLGIPARNLDTFFTGEEGTRKLFLKDRREGELVVMEGVMGLYDGLGGIREEGSSYHLAKVTQTPIILVVDGISGFKPFIWQPDLVLVKDVYEGAWLPDFTVWEGNGWDFPAFQRKSYGFGYEDVTGTFGVSGDSFLLELAPQGEPSLYLRTMGETGKGICLYGHYSPRLLRFALWMGYGLMTVRKDTVALHGSCIVYKGKAVLFLGESGTGKSTHTRLWRENIAGSKLLNDDSPIVRYEEGGVWVYGSPWSGKTPCYKAECYPLAGCVRLSQAPYNKIRRLNTLQAYAALHPSAPPAFAYEEELYSGVCSLLEKMVSSIPVYHLECLPDAEAVKLVCRTLYGDGYEADSE